MKQQHHTVKSKTTGLGKFHLEEVPSRGLHPECEIEVNLLTNLLYCICCTNIWTLELPGNSCHDIYSICSSNANADGTKPTSIWCVRVCADQHHSWVSIVLQDDLLMHENLHLACQYQLVVEKA